MSPAQFKAGNDQGEGSRQRPFPSLCLVKTASTYGVQISPRFVVITGRTTVLVARNSSPEIIYGRPDNGGGAGQEGEAGVESGGDLWLPPPGLGQHWPHPRRREDVRGVHHGAADRPRRHLRPAAPQYRPREHRRQPLPAGRGGVPGQGARRRLLPVRLPRVQLLHLRPSEERAGLGLAAAERVGGQGRRRGERVGEVRRQADGVPRPAGRGVPGHALRQQARGVRAGALPDQQVRRRREPGRSGDGGAAEEDPPGSAGVRAQAHPG